LSEMGVDTIRRAHAVQPVSDLQIEYAAISRGPEAKIFPVLEELGIGVTAYGVLSRGLLSGSKPTAGGDIRGHFPRFSRENLAQNERVVEVWRQLAAEKGLTPVQLAIAWVLAKGRRIVPVIGARTRKQLSESLAAIPVRLAGADTERIEASIPPAAIAGSRYEERQMRMLDSER
jgi:aryl-alcohol dehydrogenase-like predicted oxidoreductase